MSYIMLSPSSTQHVLLHPPIQVLLPDKRPLPSLVTDVEALKKVCDQCVTGSTCDASPPETIP